MGLFGEDISSPVEKAKKKRYVMYEDTPPTGIDVQKYVKRNWPGDYDIDREKMLSGEMDSKEYSSTRAGLFNSAYNDLGMPVTAQSDSDLWSGTRNGKTLSESMFYDYDDKTKKRSSVYNPQ